MPVSGQYQASIMPVSQYQASNFHLGHNFQLGLKSENIEFWKSQIFIFNDFLESRGAAPQNSQVEMKKSQKAV